MSPSGHELLRRTLNQRCASVSDLEATLSPTIGLIGGGVVGGWVRKNHTTAMINPLPAPMLPNVSNETSKFSLIKPVLIAYKIVITTGDKNPEIRPEKARAKNEVLSRPGRRRRTMGNTARVTGAANTPPIVAANRNAMAKTLANFRPPSADVDP